MIEKKRNLNFFIQDLQNKVSLSRELQGPVMEKWALEAKRDELIKKIDSTDQEEESRKLYNLENELNTINLLLIQVEKTIHELIRNNIEFKAKYVEYMRNRASKEIISDPANIKKNREFLKNKNLKHGESIWSENRLN